MKPIEKFIKKWTQDKDSGFLKPLCHVDDVREILLLQEVKILESVAKWADKNSKEISDPYQFDSKYDYSDFVSLPDFQSFIQEELDRINAGL